MNACMHVCVISTHGPVYTTKRLFPKPSNNTTLKIKIRSSLHSYMHTYMHTHTHTHTRRWHTVANGKTAVCMDTVRSIPNMEKLFGTDSLKMAYLSDLGGLSEFESLKILTLAAMSLLLETDSVKTCVCLCIVSVCLLSVADYLKSRRQAAPELDGLLFKEGNQLPSCMLYL
jgi:hypothetical protein